MLALAAKGNRYAQRVVDLQMAGRASPVALLPGMHFYAAPAAPRRNKGGRRLSSKEASVSMLQGIRNVLKAVKYVNPVFTVDDFNLATVDLTLTAYCNRRCPFCCASTSLLKKGQKKDPSKTISRSTIRKFLGFCEKNHRKIKRCVITGDGEPFLEFGKLLYLISNIRVASLTIKTNGLWAKNKKERSKCFRQITKAAEANPHLKIVLIIVSVDDEQHRNTDIGVDIVDTYLTCKNNGKTDIVGDKVGLHIAVAAGINIENYFRDFFDLLRKRDIQLDLGVSEGFPFLGMNSSKNPDVVVGWLPYPAQPTGQGYLFFDEMRRAWGALYDFHKSISTRLRLSIPLFGMPNCRDPFVSLDDYRPNNFHGSIGCRYDSSVLPYCFCESPHLAMGDISMTLQEWISHANQSPFLRAIRVGRMRDLLHAVSRVRPDLTEKIPFGVKDIEIMDWLLSQGENLIEYVLQFILQQDYNDGCLTDESAKIIGQQFLCRSKSAIIGDSSGGAGRGGRQGGTMGRASYVSGDIFASRSPDVNSDGLQDPMEMVWARGLGPRMYYYGGDVINGTGPAADGRREVKGKKLLPVDLDSWSATSDIQADRKTEPISGPIYETACKLTESQPLIEGERRATLNIDQDISPHLSARDLARFRLAVGRIWRDKFNSRIVLLTLRDPIKQINGTKLPFPIEVLLIKGGLLNTQRPLAAHLGAGAMGYREVSDARGRLYMVPSIAAPEGGMYLEGAVNEFVIHHDVNEDKRLRVSGIFFRRQIAWGQFLDVAFNRQPLGYVVLGMPRKIIGLYSLPEKESHIARGKALRSMHDCGYVGSMLHGNNCFILKNMSFVWDFETVCNLARTRMTESGFVTAMLCDLAYGSGKSGDEYGTFGIVMPGLMSAFVGGYFDQIRDLPDLLEQIKQAKEGLWQGGPLGQISNPIISRLRLNCLGSSFQFLPEIPLEQKIEIPSGDTSCLSLKDIARTLIYHIAHIPENPRLFSARSVWDTGFFIQGLIPKRYKGLMEALVRLPHEESLFSPAVRGAAKSLKEQMDLSFLTFVCQLSPRKFRDDCQKVAESIKRLGLTKPELSILALILQAEGISRDIPECVDIINAELGSFIPVSAVTSSSSGAGRGAGQNGANLMPAFRIKLPWPDERPLLPQGVLKRWLWGYQQCGFVGRRLWGGAGSGNKSGQDSDKKDGARAGDGSSHSDEKVGKRKPRPKNTRSRDKNKKVVNGIRAELKFSMEERPSPTPDKAFSSYAKLDKEIKRLILDIIKNSELGRKEAFRDMIEKDTVCQRIMSGLEGIGGLGDNALMELCKNSYDSWIDKIDERRIKPKGFVGRLNIEAYYVAGDVVINVEDNGKTIELENDGTPIKRRRAERVKYFSGGIGIAIKMITIDLNKIKGSIKWRPLKNGTKTQIRIPKEKLSPKFNIEKDEYIVIPEVENQSKNCSKANPKSAPHPDKKTSGGARKSGAQGRSSRHRLPNGTLGCIALLGILGVIAAALLTLFHRVGGNGLAQASLWFLPIVGVVEILRLPQRETSSKWGLTIRELISGSRRSILINTCGWPASRCSLAYSMLSLLNSVLSSRRKTTCALVGILLAKSDSGLDKRYRSNSQLIVLCRFQNSLSLISFYLLKKMATIGFPVHIQVSFGKSQGLVIVHCKQGSLFNFSIKPQIISMREAVSSIITKRCMPTVFVIYLQLDPKTDNLTFKRTVGMPFSAIRTVDYHKISIFDIGHLLFQWANIDINGVSHGLASSLMRISFPISTDLIFEDSSFRRVFAQDSCALSDDMNSLGNTTYLKRKRCGDQPFNILNFLFQGLQRLHNSIIHLKPPVKKYTILLESRQEILQTQSNADLEEGSRGGGAGGGGRQSGANPMLAFRIESLGLDERPLLPQGLLKYGGWGFPQCGLVGRRLYDNGNFSRRVKTGFEIEQDPKKRAKIVRRNRTYLKSKGWFEPVKNLPFRPKYILNDGLLPEFIEQIIKRDAWMRRGDWFYSESEAIYAAVEKLTGKSIRPKRKKEVRINIKKIIRENIESFAYLLQSVYCFACGKEEKGFEVFQRYLEVQKRSKGLAMSFGEHGKLICDVFSGLGKFIYLQGMHEYVRARFLLNLALRFFSWKGFFLEAPDNLAKELGAIDVWSGRKRGINALKSSLRISNRFASEILPAQARADNGLGKGLRKHFNKTKRETLKASSFVKEEGIAVVLGAGVFVVLPLVEMLRERFPNGKLKYRKIVLVELAENYTDQALKRLLREKVITKEEAERIELVVGDGSLVLDKITHYIDGMMLQAISSNEEPQIPIEKLLHFVEEIANPLKMFTYVIPKKERILRNEHISFIVFSMSLQDFADSIKQYVEMWLEGFGHWVQGHHEFEEQWERYSDRIEMGLTAILLDDAARQLIPGGIFLFIDAKGSQRPREDGQKDEKVIFRKFKALSKFMVQNFSIAGQDFAFRKVHTDSWTRPINKDNWSESSDPKFIVGSIAIEKISVKSETSSKPSLQKPARPPRTHPTA